MNSSTPRQRGSKERLADIASQVGQWREITGQATAQDVQPGSSLDADDQAFPLYPASHHAWHGISHAVDHLDMFMHPLVESNLSFPLAPQTLARSGVLGAAHALWVLDATTRPVRQIRALRLAHEEFQNERKAYEQLANSGAATAEMAAIVATRVEWIGRAVKAGVALGATATQVQAKLVETDVIDDVLRRYEVAHPSPDDHLLRTYRLIWRMHSGVAHGFRWPVTYRTDFTNAVMEGEEQRQLGGLVTNDEDQLITSAIAMSLLIGRAFDLYNNRRVKH